MYIFSPQGRQKYQAILERAQARSKSDAVEIGKAAGDNCDWHDNGAFDSAMQDAAISAARLGDIREKISKARVIPYPKETRGEIEYGTKVIVTWNNEREEYLIVGFGDQNPERNRILYDSPLAKALMRKKVGEEIIFPPERGSKIRIEDILTISEDEVK